MRDPRHILITGASSGIGAALAKFYAAPGMRLSLIGRNHERLTSIAAECADMGAQVESTCIDVRDVDALSKWMLVQDDVQPVDLVIANAGVSAGTFGGGESEAQVRELFAINVDGVMNTLFPLLPRMKQRRRGQLGLMSSIASFRSFPGAPAYCATKAAVRFLGEGMRLDLRSSGVQVNVICPGYIRTPMTEQNHFFMPFIMDADRAAHIIKRDLARNVARIIFPLRLYLIVWVLMCLPHRLLDPLLQLLPGKPSQSR